MLERREFVVALMASLLKFGAATHLVENLMVSVAEALHIRSQCSAFPKMMFMTFRSPDGDPSKLQSRVLSLSPSMDLGKLDACDRLAGQIAAKQVGFEEAKGELNRILMEEPEYHWALRLFAFTMVGSMATMLFYGGHEMDGVLAAGLGLLVGLCDLYGQYNDTFSRVNDFVCAFLCAFISRLVHTYVLPESTCYFSVALGPLVYLLPGFSTTTGVTEVASGSVMSGSARIFGAFVGFLQLGFGLVVGSRIAVWDPIHESDWCSNELPDQYKILLLLPCVFSLGVIFKIPPTRHFLAAMASACVGFFVSVFLEQYETLPPDTLSFLASFAVGAFGCLYARIADRPPISIVVIGILVLVPGGIGVRGVAAFFSEDSVSGVTLGTQMFGVSLSITLGLLVAKMLIMPVKNKAKRYYQPSLI